MALVGALPAIALAGCGGPEAQDAGGQDTGNSSQATEQPGHDSNEGAGHDAADVSRTVEIGMDDTMRFTPDSLTVNAGETVRFVIHNNGQIPHEFGIGSMSELLEHAEMMRKMPGMQHTESNMLTLDPGAEGEIIWQFGESGTVDFACLIPGHLEAGMKGVVQVE